jgi:hypothetical protein
MGRPVQCAVSRLPFDTCRKAGITQRQNGWFIYSRTLPQKSCLVDLNVTLHSLPNLNALWRMTEHFDLKEQN